jgi:2-keto-4-pentenoate hydratase
MTTLTTDEIKAVAKALDEAERSRKQIGLISLRHPQATMDDAYAIQDAWVREKIAGGREVIGWKIGLTSKAMQYALNRIRACCSTICCSRMARRYPPTASSSRASKRRSPS